MRKKVFGRHFSRSRKAREALLKSLIRALILHGKIETSLAKAKAISGDIDGVVRLAKEGSVSALRQISAFVSADRKFVAKFVKDTASFGKRSSGYTRLTRLPRRLGDAAEMARIEWVDQVEVVKVPKVSKVPKVKKQKTEMKKKRRTVLKGGRQKGAKSPSEKG